MKMRQCILFAALILTGCAAAARGADDFARRLIHAAGVDGGLVVHVGCAGGQLTAALHTNGRYVVHGLDTKRAHVEAARRHFASLGLCGPVNADTFDGRHLPYADNLINLLVVTDRFDVPMDEMLRTLAPEGVALLAPDAATAARDRSITSIAIDGRPWAKIIKPRPAEIDQWTHYLHGPDNNAVAQDSVVGPPRHMQWLAGPWWTRNHHRLNSISSAVTAGGRLFSIVDEAPSANIFVPSKWVLVARDAFSGITLWKKRLESWAWHTIRFRSGPPQLPRLLVATGDRVYVPLGLNAPVSAIDGATGKTLKTYESTGGAEEILVVDGTLIVLKGTPVAEQAFQHAAFQGRYVFPNRKSIIVVEAATGQRRWTWSDPDAHPLPETLAADGTRVFIQTTEGVVCLDLESGEERWRFTEAGQRETRRRVTYGKYTLVVSDGVVLCKMRDQLVALSVEDGHKLWQCKAGDGFHSPVDVFVINGLVWMGSHVDDSVAPPPVEDFNVGRDLHTGKIKVTNAVAVDLQTAGHHHRCYREKATCRYILTGKRGIELIDLVDENHSRNNWVRGTCQYGILPANGLIYSPPHACGCYMEAKLRGFWALASERAAPRPSAAGARAAGAAERLERGPAYGKTCEDRASPAAEQATRTAAGSKRPGLVGAWPQYRHDRLRSGVADTVVPTDLKPAWRTKIGGRLSQPVVAEGKVLVAAIDNNAVHALDAASGEILWTYLAGGRVDSPPAIHEGKALFGSADGHVYCVRLSDGQLVWRFRAAQADRRAVAMDQVESVWPVHGSVLMLDGIAYCSAGRSTWLDGGIDLYGLNPTSGSIVYQAHFESRPPRIGEGKDRAGSEYDVRIDQNVTDYKTFLQPDRSDSFSMAGGSVSDVLVSDGRNVFLHHVKFNARLEKQERMSRHLFSTSSLLDDTENHRSHWVLGTGDFSRIPVAYSWIANRPGRRSPTIAVPAGVMLVFDGEAVWGVRRGGDATGKYSLFKRGNAPFSDDEPSLPDFRRIPRKQAEQYVWKVGLPVRPRAMLKSGDHLYLGVMPTVGKPGAAHEGRGGAIWIASAEDGSKRAEYPLDAPVVWDGMAAAAGKLFVATGDGSLRCFGPSL